MLPLTTTLVPMSGLPDLSVILPLMVTWASAAAVNAKNDAVRKSLFIIVVSVCFGGKPTLPYGFTVCCSCNLLDESCYCRLTTVQISIGSSPLSIKRGRVVELVG